MHDIYELIGRRATCRAYKPDPIPDDVLSRVLEAGCKSPSGGGFQSISIIRITDPAKRKRLVEFSRGQKFIGIAPVSLVFCVDYHRMRRVIEQEPAPFRLQDQFKYLMMGVIDTSICAQTMVLAAEAEGLASCYNGNILNVMDQISELLELPEQVFPVVMLTLGWPRTDRRRQPPKYPASLLVHENAYQERADEALYAAYRKQNRWQKLPAKPEWVETCCTVAERLHGADYAARVRKDIEEKGYIGPYQYWFGCYYLDGPDFMTNKDYQSYFKKQGFEWLEEKEKIVL